MTRHSGGAGGNSRKYHAQKRGVRTPYGYQRRLTARDLSKTPAMPDLAALRRRQSSDAWLAEHPWIAARLPGTGIPAAELEIV